MGETNLQAFSEIAKCSNHRAVNKIIVHAGRKYSMIFSILRDTGLRPIELHRLTLRDIDLDKGIIHPSTAKGGKARVLKLKKPTLAMLKEYPLFSNVILYPQKRGFISQTKMINAMSSKIANYECP